ncbi:hypothetical protein E2C01_092495 [Portunus trituberculatus]|uniref:Uncharacterized protein n=1 Tax=Portunus trituberculatus TaxID=210409 RepID=A0A5B7JXX5_PORTR|nr:hypothetical protein [Portunus trituberculatus]
MEAEAAVRRLVKRSPQSRLRIRNTSG